MPAAPAAIPPKPNTAAMMATIRKITVQRNIILSFNFYNKIPVLVNKNIMPD